jgi:hypothetical protein
MTIFALTLGHGPGWDPGRGIRDQQGWDEHAAFMDGLVDDGFVILGGPLGDGEQALHMVEARDEQEVAARMGEDPWAPPGLLRIAALERWSIWLDSRPDPAGRPPPGDVQPTGSDQPAGDAQPPGGDRQQPGTSDR